MISQTDRYENFAFFESNPRQEVKHARYAQTNPIFDAKTHLNVIGAKKISSLLHTTHQAIVVSADGNRSIYVDPTFLTKAFQCVQQLLEANPDFSDYSGLRNFVSRFERHLSVCRSAMRSKQLDLPIFDFVASFERTVNNLPALYELLNAAPEGTDEKMALDLLFITLEG